MQLQFLVYVSLLFVAFGTRVKAWPVDGVEAAENSSGSVNATKNSTVAEERPKAAQQTTDLEAAGSEEANNQYVGAVGTVMVSTKLKKM